MKEIKDNRGAKERILATAVQLFYSRGVNNVGIDEIIRCSGVAKMSLYNHFKSKDELIVAFLERINQQWIEWMKARVIALAPNPERRLLVLFDALEEWFKTPEFRGCPFINTTAEVSDNNHAAYKVALKFKQGLFDYICELVVTAKLSQPKIISNQVLLLVDGAIIRAAMTKEISSAKVATVIRFTRPRTCFSPLIRYSPSRSASERAIRFFISPNVWNMCTMGVPAQRSERAAAAIPDIQ